MTTAIFVDSRLKAVGTDSSFEINLRESVHLSNARLRVDKINFTDSFLTTDAGSNLYFSIGASLSSVSIPEGAYTGTSLASALQTATGRATDQFNHPHVGCSESAVAFGQGPRRVQFRLSKWSIKPRS